MEDKNNALKSSRREKGDAKRGKKGIKYAQNCTPSKEESHPNKGQETRHQKDKDISSAGMVSDNLQRQRQTQTIILSRFERPGNGKKNMDTLPGRSQS